MVMSRILFVNQEILPFTPETELSQFGRYLPAYAQEHGREIRVFMPRFSSINERRNQLHEVIRLTGMNIVVNNSDRQLIIKVGSIPSARMQVYFIDNEEYFSKHGPMLGENGTLHDDTDERLLFFGKGTLEAVRKLAWRPHLVHFSGWFTSMIPFYLRRINKDNAFFNGTKMVCSICGDDFSGTIREEIERKLRADKATTKDLSLLHDLDYTNLMKAAITYSNAVVVTSPNANPELVDFAKENKKHVIDYNPDRDIFFEQINKLYDSLVGTNIN